MATVNLPAAEIMALHAAILRAMERAEGDEWSQLNASRAFVKCYLVDKIPALPVTVQPEAEAA